MPQPTSCQFPTTPVDDALSWPRPFRVYLDEPLDQRPAGSVGKCGECRLSFSAKSGKTRLQQTFVSHPFHLTHPWYLDPALPDMAVVYVQTPAGGFIQGDRAHLCFTLDSAAQVHITNQAAEKIHTMTANCALQRISFALDAGAYAEYCPEPTILFPGSRYGQQLQIQLGTEASFFLADIFLAYPSADGLTFDALTTSLRVTDDNGRLLVRDHSLVLPAHYPTTGPGILAQHHVWGQAFFIGPNVPAVWAREVHDQLSSEPHTVCGTTLLPQDRGLCVKVVGTDVRAVRRVLHMARHQLRLSHLGVQATQFLK